MQEIKLGIVETHFANIIWENSPIPSPELVKLCEKELGWKKSTTYTVLKKLCDRGIFENIAGTVITKINREEFYSIQSEKFVVSCIRKNLQFVQESVAKAAIIGQ